MADSALGGSRLPQALAIVSWLTVALVLVQAILAGRFLYVDDDLIDVHEVIANIVFLVVVAQAILTYLIGRRGGATRTHLIVAGLLVVLVVAQIGLGYSGEDGGEAAALHVANGVLVFGLSVVAVMLGREARFAVTARKEPTHGGPL